MELYCGYLENSQKIPQYFGYLERIPLLRIPREQYFGYLERIPLLRIPREQNILESKRKFFLKFHFFGLSTQYAKVISRNISKTGEIAQK